MKLKIATIPYDRINALRTGEVVPKGIDLNYVTDMPGHSIFLRMIEQREFDVSEMSYGLHAVQRTRDSFPYVGLPLFMHRLFHHSQVYVNRASGIKIPRDLEGRKVGVQEYRQSTLIWTRGMLRDDHGVDTLSFEWIEGGVNHPRRPRPSDVRPPEGVTRIRTLDDEGTLSDALADGRVEAVISAREPASFRHSEDVIRLFPDFRTSEEQHYLQTGIFPIMHIIVMREELYEESPWVAQSLYDAFCEAKAEAWRRLHFGAPAVMAPWLALEVARTESIFGGDPFPYGIERNRRTLETFLRYLTEDRLLAEAPALETLFVPVAEQNGTVDEQTFIW